MKFSLVVLSSILTQLAIAAPVYVTDYVTHIVTVTVQPGQTQVLGSAASVATSAASAASAASVAASVAAPAASTASGNAETTAYSATSVATSAASSATSSASSSDSSFASEILAEHNAKRALHGVSDLTWDDTLASYAQDYADNYDCSGTLTHSGGSYGENLALGYSTTGSVDAWYSEGDDFDYTSCNVYDHFTQVIWKSSTKLGCGQKKCNDYWGTYIICSYDPAGNMVGDCPSNVLPLV
ncbi:hypothetical protein FOA43_003009 [Brettanomyces nanus]|uniref:SCP domain-containing protein n=1 Tax=Eeniella nana TaxID=13502 RepID=A0A875S6N7_EENNA|nr:uncharacterized protein FOA43_003009 [Brettanomyces nanus]QPG75652.1 hypothetical protein FOA43_003009 [Brettanomyces nanus]